jgi:Domain of unknown function (DUF4112)
MISSRTAAFEALRMAGPTRADALARITLLTRFLDSAFVIPGTNRRVGFDAIIGLVPGIGDAVTTLLASYIIWEARQLGLPRWKIARMIGNVALDTVLGAIPLAGDVFDVLFKANQRNLRIIHDHLGIKRGPREIDGTAVRIETASCGAGRADAFRKRERGVRYGIARCSSSAEDLGATPGLRSPRAVPMEAGPADVVTPVGSPPFAGSSPARVIQAAFGHS